MFCCVPRQSSLVWAGEQFSSIVDSGESPSKCWPNSSSFCRGASEAPAARNDGTSFDGGRLSSWKEISMALQTGREQRA